MPKKGPDKRVHVTFDDSTREILELISAKEKRPMAEIVRKFTESWMERYEDKYWCDLVAQEPRGKTISHKEVWGV